MSIMVDWDDEDHTIVRMKYKGDWTNDELRRIGTHAIMMIRTVEHLVYVINDFTESAGVPVGVLWQAGDLNQMRPANWAAGVSITGDRLARNLLDLFGSVYMEQRKHQLYVVKTNEEALEVIKELKSKKRDS